MNSQDEFTVKIGIVIPIYNVAKYLRECLDSVVNQSYGNFCAVLVNDGSTDNSKEIALEYVAKDSRFVLIDKENGGQSSARNAGIDYFNDEIESSLQDSTNHALLSSLRGKAEAIHKNKIIDCHDLTSSSLAMTSEGDSSLQGVANAEAIHKSKINCHDSPLQNLVMMICAQNLTLYHNAKSTSNPPKIDYIIFLDSDDFWAVDLLEKCVDSALKYKAQIVWFSWKTFYDGIDNPSVNGGGDSLGLAFMATHKRAS